MQFRKQARNAGRISRTGTAVAALLLATTAAADVYQSGEHELPWCSGIIIEWELKYSKTPDWAPVPGAKEIHFWMDLNIKDPQGGEDCSFVVCAMINVDKPKIMGMPAFDADLNVDTWECTSTGTQTWYPNYHLGCKQVRLYSGNTTNGSPTPYFQNVFDQTAAFSLNIVEEDIAAAYVDFAVDCPNGFSNCSLFDSADKWLVPGDGLGTSGTSSWWVMGVPDFKCPEEPEIHEGRALLPTGNWWTMAYHDNVYESVLEGELSNAPIGSELVIEFPPSTGGGSHTIPVRREVTTVRLPFAITPELGQNGENEHTFITLRHHESLPLPDRSRSIRLLGQITATNATYKPDGEKLYEPGDFMHGIDYQVILENDLPTLLSQELIRVSSEYYDFALRAADESSSVVAAALRYTIDGKPLPWLALPYDAGFDPEVIGKETWFAARLGPFTPEQVIDQYEIKISDHARNEALFVVTPRVERHALLATGTLSLGAHTEVLEGVVAAAAELRVDSHVDVVGAAAAETVKLGSRNNIGTLCSTNLSQGQDNTFAAAGFVTVAEPPAFVAGRAAGSAPVFVAPRTTRLLPPGDYGSIRLGTGATLLLQAGIYTVTEVRLGAGAAVRPASGTEPCDAFVYVAGDFTARANTDLTVNAFAHRAALGPRTELTGTVIADDVQVGRRSTVRNGSCTWR